MSILKRDLEDRILKELCTRTEHPNVILLEGVRQVGKTTLIENISHSKASHTNGLKEYAHLYGCKKALLVNLSKPQRWQTDAGLEIVSVPVYLLSTGIKQVAPEAK